MMIDLKTAGRRSSSSEVCYQTTVGSSHSCSSRQYPHQSTMDNDWYYRWMLFSHLQQRQHQQQEFHQKLIEAAEADAAAAREMTLVNAQCVCGLCERPGPDIKHTPETISRILHALNLKLPKALSKRELNDKIGLCNECEHKVKKLEEAASIREQLKSSLFSILSHVAAPPGMFTVRHVFL